MNRQTYLANRFREVILNGTWIANTNFKKEVGIFVIAEQGKVGSYCYHEPALGNLLVPNRVRVNRSPDASAQPVIAQDGCEQQKGVFGHPEAIKKHRSHQQPKRRTPMADSADGKKACPHQWQKIEDESRGSEKHGSRSTK